jgi:O-antigen ligase
MTKKIDIRKSLLFLLEKLSLRTMSLFVSVPIFITAILFTHSRAGALSVASGVLVLFTAVTLTKAVRLRRITGVILIIAIAGYSFFSLSGKAVSDRMADAGYSLSDRLNYYVLVMEEIKERPMIGIGYGNYPDASWKIRDQSVKKHWDKVHNTYLESALELGIPMTIVLFGTLLIAALVCLFGVRARNRNEIYPSIGLAVITIVGIHSLVDFSIQIPAVAITFSLLLGVAYAQAWPSERTAGDANDAPENNDGEWRPKISRRSRKRAV